jgi:hypothetical protein
MTERHVENVPHDMPSTAPPTTDDASPGARYWALSRQPLVSLAFVAPLLAVYEVGVLALGAKAVRNGADVWLRGLLELLDFGNYFLLPVLVVGILLGWHHTTRQPWRVPRGVLWGMAVESVVLALCLRGISYAAAIVLHAGLAPMFSTPTAAALASGTSASAARLIGFLGAGVYEELLFRLILLCAAAWAIRRSGATNRTATVAAVLVTSVVFAAAHYVGPYGEAILWREFGFWYGLTFRFLAGVFFSVLFVARGFGIAAGAHAGYDILVKLI